MEVWSTEPGVRIYSGNFLEGKVPRDQGKGVVVYRSRGAFCVEPSHFPDAINHPEFEAIVLNPGEWYTGEIVYKLSTDRK